MSKKTRVLIAIAVVCSIGAAVSQYSSTPAHAQGGCAVPKSYGAVKASLSLFLVFEAADGTIRLVNPDSCQALSTITRN
jgi:hypothetical protein